MENKRKKATVLTVQEIYPDEHSDIGKPSLKILVRQRRNGMGTQALKDFQETRSLFLLVVGEFVMDYRGISSIYSLSHSCSFSLFLTNLL